MPLAAVAGAGIGGGLPPPAAAPKAKKIVFGIVKTTLRAGRKTTLKVKVSAAGKVELRQGKRRLAGPAVVKRGTATFKIRLARAGRAKLTAVFTPAGGGPTVTKLLTVTATR